MSCYSNHLLPHEMAAVSEYTLRLHEILGHELIGLWLFGSKVRGDWGPDSDIDFLLVLKSVLPETRWRVWELASDISPEYDILLNTHIIDAVRWKDERRYRGTLWCEIERDGVPLRPDVSPASATAD